jgi:SAM-dependent methyltransferase
MDRRWYEQVREIERNHWWFAGRRRILLAVLERLDVRAESILGVGCGSGSNLELLRERFSEEIIHGIDIDLESLRHCARNRSTLVSQADLTHLPFRDGCFDLVCALDAIEHVPDDEMALRGLRRVCRSGGTLLATVPAFGFLWGNVDRVGHHYRRYTRRELTDLIERSGFAVRFVRYFNTALFPAIAGIRLAARLFPARDVVDGERVRTDFDIAKSGPLNTALARVFGAEASLLGWSPPFGVSIVCVAQRPTESGGRAAAHRGVSAPGRETR